MSAMHLFAGGEPVRVRPDFSSQPLTIRLPVDRRPAVIVLAIVCIWGAVGTIFTFQMLAPLTSMASQPMMMLAFALGFLISLAILYMGWRALRLYVAEQEIVIGNGEVHYSGRSLLAAPRWQEPLASYRGLRPDTIPAEDGQPWQIIELAHAQPERSLPLFSDRGPHQPTHILRSLAEQLKLPVIHAD